MRNKLSLLFLLVFGIFASLSKTQAQTIQLVQPTPLPPTVCQCDTLNINYLVSGASFNLSTRFYWEATTNSNDWTNADTLAFTGLMVGGNPAGPTDTASSGSKLAMVAIPCDQDPINNLFIRLRADDLSQTISDTIFYDVLRKTDSKIESIVGGFPNPYTSVDAWSFCPGDSIFLVAENVGSFFQWKSGGVDIPGETNDTLVVKSGGQYSVDTWVSLACKTESADTLVIPITDNQNTAINLISAPPVGFQIDNPDLTNVSIDDSVQFCEDMAPQIRAAANPPAGVNFSYQWIADSITTFGDTVFYNTRLGDTLRVLNIDSSLITESPQRFYVIVSDGNCTDTSQPYYAFMDSIPVTDIRHRIYRNGNPGPSMTGTLICMKDSVRLISTVVKPGWEYQWQRFTSTNTWQDLPNALNPNVNGTSFSLEVNPDILPVQSISRYRLRVNTVTPQGDAVCSFFTDSVLIRYQPGFKVTHTPDPLIKLINTDTINFCATDSATLVAPATPTQLQNLNFFYNFQWAREAFDSTAGAVVPVIIPGATQRTFKIKTGGVYYSIIDDGICVDTSDAFYVYVDSVPSTTVVPRPFVAGNPTPDLNLCLTDSVLLTVDTVVGWDYQWQVSFGNGNSWSSLLNDTLPYITVDSSYKFFGIDTLFFRMSTSYENRFGEVICPDTSNEVRVIFFNPPTINFFPDDTVQLCQNDSVLVIAQGNSLSYLWNDGSLSPQRYFTQPGLYTVTGTGINGCTTTKQVFVELFTTTANAGPDVTTTSETEVTLSASGGNSYQWSANKPIASGGLNQQTIVVSYKLPDGVTRDTVVLTVQVTNARGCTDTDEMLLIVTSGNDSLVELISQAWNYFSPNGDGRNDVWDISPIVKEVGGVCRIMIMNRWGSVVYVEEDFKGIWTGANQGGTDLPDGTYYYVLGCDDKVILKNAITLIRNN